MPQSRSRKDALVARRLAPRAVWASCLAVGCMALASGCGPKGSTSPAAKSPERQSEAEYDVALDTFSKGQPRPALDHALKAIELDDTNAKALYLTSIIYQSFCSGDRGLKSPDCRIADAEKYARRALQVDESFRDARNNLGAVLIVEGKNAEAIELLIPLTKDPAYTESHLAWGNLGWAQVQSGQLEEGITSLKNSITQPRFCVGHYRLGVAYEKKGSFAEADASLTNALTIDECKALQDGWEARARVRMKLGKVADARADLERCREISVETEAGQRCAKLLAGAVSSAPGSSVRDGTSPTDPSVASPTSTSTSKGATPPRPAGAQAAKGSGSHSGGEK